jgi:2-deoxy-D-gluconate 3-dehydrogenase
VEWGRYGINVNAVAPGFVVTPMTAGLRADAERMRSIVQRTPLGRMAHPEEIAAGIWFLVSPASDFITGVVLPIDGDMLAA